MSEENKEFKVEDKRSYVRDESGDFVKRDHEDSTKSQAEKEPIKASETKAKSDSKIPLPELNFPTFILSLHTNALMHLGVLSDPHDPEADMPPNLSLASQTIDLISMLKEKTKGNLNEHEVQMMDQVLFDLRMKFVQAKKGAKTAKTD